VLVRELRWVHACLLGLLLFAIDVPALAQHHHHSGGSFGGSHFHHSGGSHSGGSSYRYRGSRTHWGSSRGGSSDTAGLWIVLLVILVAVLFVSSQLAKARRGAGEPSHGARGWRDVDVSALTLAIDWRARRRIQADLKRFAKRGRTRTKQQLGGLLRATVGALRKAETSWLYAHVHNYRPMSSPAAESAFRQLTVDARSRFRNETVRNADGHLVESDGGTYEARPEEGEGVVVVTVVVAARGELPNIRASADAAELHTLLDALEEAARPKALVALEVIWAPSVENDRMSTAELEELYPKLEKLDERSLAGRIFCDHCRGPFSAELRKCPHCGAPGPERRAAA
jgi:uncharacterized membrane protein